MDNLDLWNRVSKTNPAHTKKLKLGRTITAIDPYRQVESATEEFGPAGKGWGWRVIRVEHLPTNEVAVLIELWHGDETSNIGSIQQWGQASLYIDKAEKIKDKDLMKKATTDGITKCLSYLGFNADIFLGKFDDNKYVEEMKAEFNKQEYAIDEITGQWIAGIKAGTNKIEEITDPTYRKFIMENLNNE